jgi:hypothetical protein
LRNASYLSSVRKKEREMSLRNSRVFFLFFRIYSNSTNVFRNFRKECFFFTKDDIIYNYMKLAIPVRINCTVFRLVGQLSQPIRFRCTVGCRSKSVSLEILFQSRSLTPMAYRLKKRKNSPQNLIGRKNQPMGE